jgi:phytoene dehydrogenase-like protein
MPSPDIAILGGGISGIIAALELEARGVFPTLYESTDRLGGRVKTDFFDDIPLDHGFQVLLTAYPEVIKYLDLSALELHYFKPGAYIFRKDGKVELIGDAFRDRSFLWPTIKANSASLFDKMKLLAEQRRISDLCI